MIKKTMCVLAILLVVPSLFAQTATIVSTNTVGGVPVQSWCITTSHNGGTANMSATLAGGELSITGRVMCDQPAYASAVVQGSLWWVIQYAGSSPPPTPANVVIQFTTDLIMDTQASNDFCFASEVGDEAVGNQTVMNGGAGKWINTVQDLYTTVASWTEVSPGVWQGSTGYYTANIGLNGSTAPLPAPNNSMLIRYTHSVSPYSVGGVLVSY